MATTPNYAADGKAIMDNLVLGTAIGLPASGLYYLVKKWRKQLDEQIERNKPRAPDYTDVALDLPALPAPTQKKLAFDFSTIGAPAVGGLTGAILANALSKKENKKRNALLGAAAGAAAGAGLNTKPVHETIAKNLPNSILWMVPGLNKAYNPDSHEYRGWKEIAGVGGGALGLLGGKALYDLSAGQHIDVEKKKEQYNEVARARQKYFDELLKTDNTEKKSSLDEALDAVYDSCTSIKQSSGYGLFGTEIGSDFNPVKYWDLLRQYYGVALAGAGLGGGVIGAKYMYDKTTAQSKAKNMAKALAARDRMKNSLPVWVDPRELAMVKDVAKSDEASDSSGV